MSASPSAAVPRIFYHPAYWCHSCDMSIGLPPSPTPNALLCPHCHRDSLEQMEMEDYISPPSPAPRDAFTPFDDNFLLTSPYLHRLIHHLTAAESDPRSDAAPRSSIESLPEVAITADSDPTLLCPVCKDPFLVNSAAKMMPCKHAYHTDCIVPWLEINNSCPVCRSKLPAAEEARSEGGEDGYLGLEELADQEEDLFGFRNTLRHIARRQSWNQEANNNSNDNNNNNNIGNGSQGNLLSSTQIGEVERGSGVLERAGSVETVSSSWPRWQPEERSGGNDDGGGAFPRS